MNRLVERDRDGGHLTWSSAESSPPAGAPFLHACRNIKEAQSEWRRRCRKKKEDAEIIAENFQTVDVILNVRQMVVIPSTRSFHPRPCVNSLSSDSFPFLMPSIF